MGSENIESRQIITEQACPCQTLLGTPWVQSQDQQLRPCQSPQHLELFCKQLCHPLPCLHQHGEQQRLLAWSPARGAWERGNPSLLDSLLQEKLELQDVDA